MSQFIGNGINVAAGGTSVFYSTPWPHRPGEKGRDADGNEYVFCDFTATVYYGCLVQINSLYQAAPLLGTANIAYRVGVVCSGVAVTDSGVHPTSDSGGWVQVYGVHPAVQTGDTTNGTVSDTAGAAVFCIPQTSVGTPSGTLSLIVQATAVSIINTSTEGNVINGMWIVDFAEVTNLTTWHGTSGASGPTSRNDPGGGAYAGTGDTSGAPTSAFKGASLAVFLNYPYVTGVSVPLVNATSDS